MASAEEALQSTAAKTNFQRLTRLLMRGGLTLLRETLGSIHSPANLPTMLSSPAVQTLLRSARLTRMEWNCLYPSPGVYGKSTDFDITLTFRLLRTICNLTPPVTGWDDLPNSIDLSLEADLARVKYYRNEVYGHSKTMEIPDDEFVNLWREISEALLRIAANISHGKRDEWKRSIDRFLHDPLTPDEERCVEELCQWYKRDVDVKDAVEKLDATVKQTNEELRGLREEKDIDKNLIQQLNVTVKQTNEELQQEIRGLREEKHMDGRAIQQLNTTLNEEFRTLQEDVRQLKQSIVILLEVIPAASRPALPQATGRSEGMCVIPIAPDQEQAAGEEGLQVETPENQQHLPTEIEIWNVLLSFKDSFGLFLQYFKDKLNVLVRRLDVGSLLITVECSSLQILETLWEDYSSGHLSKVAQETLITSEVLEKLERTEVKLKTFISEEEYEKVKQIFMDNSDHRSQTKALREDATHECKLRAVLSFGQCSSSVGKLYFSWGMAVNDQNEIAVTEHHNHRVLVFSSDGTHLRSFGGKGRNQGEFKWPTGIVFNTNGNITVADHFNNRIQVFSGNGKFLDAFGGEGSLDHQLYAPEGLSVTSNGDIIVADAGNKLIKIFSPGGQFVRKFGGGSLAFPYHCIQTEQYLIVSDSGDNCIKMFDLEGIFLFKFGKKGNKEGEFNFPCYLSVNKKGHLMVCDFGNHRIQVFELSGKFVTKFSTKGSEKGDFSQPISTANLSDGRIVVSDMGNDRIQIFDWI